jgi:serine-type D-Ala-D-Ala carboxypeptidase (penicillin-binding protein 5/6)
MEGRALRKARWMLAVAGAVLVAVVVAGVVQVMRPVPALSLTTNLVTPVAQPGQAQISWPRAREAAVTVDGFGKVWSSGGEAEVPTASVAKMMTAYVVLRDHPLAADADGPVITVTAEDAEEYESDVQAGDSTAKVAAGEQLTEREALEALLLPSADNVAMLLAVWDAGSAGAFTAKMNEVARSLGMEHTNYTDPSGLAASTVSTAQDQLVVVRKAMAIPVFARIVAMPSATIPVAGVIRNYNHQTGQNGIIGVKTGSDMAAQGCWAFAVRREVGGAEHVVYGVVLGAPASFSQLAPTAIAAGVRLADAMPKTVRKMTVLPAGTAIGQINVPWSKTPVPVVTARDLAGLAVAGTQVSLSTQAQAPGTASFGDGDQIGEVSVSGLTDAATTPVVTTGSSGSPSFLWRLLRR